MDQVRAAQGGGAKADWSLPSVANAAMCVPGPRGPRRTCGDAHVAASARAARLSRVRVPALVAPVAPVGVSTVLLVGAPFRTVTALVDSLRHDMACRPEHLWQPGEEAMIGVDEALARAVGRRGPDVREAPLPSDPAWTRMRAPLLDELGAPAAVRAGAGLALRRLADVRGVFRMVVGP